MRKILSVSVLVLALCAPAFAGDIPMPPAPQPLSQSSQTAEEPPSDGDAQTEEADGFTETVLNVIESVLALF